MSDFYGGNLFGQTYVTSGKFPDPIFIYFLGSSVTAKKKGGIWKSQL